jgi:hypothetical protein
METAAAARPTGRWNYTVLTRSTWTPRPRDIWVASGGIGSKALDGIDLA